MIRSGEADLVVVVKKGFGERVASPEEGETARLIALYYDKGNPAVAEIGTALIRQTVDRLNKRLVRFQPVIGMEEINVQSRPMSYIDFLVPGILSLMIMSNNLNGVAGTIASWRERGILRRMQGTPLSSATFIAGQITARIILNAVQAVAVLLVAYFAFDVHVYGSWAALIFFILLGTLTFLSIGFIIASLARSSRERRSDRRADLLSDDLCRGDFLSHPEFAGLPAAAGGGDSHRSPDPRASGHHERGGRHGGSVDADGGLDGLARRLLPGGGQDVSVGCGMTGGGRAMILGIGIDLVELERIRRFGTERLARAHFDRKGEGLFAAVGRTDRWNFSPAGLRPRRRCPRRRARESASSAFRTSKFSPTKGAVRGSASARRAGPSWGGSRRCASIFPSPIRTTMRRRWSWRSGSDRLRVCQPCLHIQRDGDIHIYRGWEGHVCT